MISVVLFATLSVSVPARAGLYETNSAQFGANSLTFDSQTGLTWLDLQYSAGLSYQQALADTAPGGIFYGFRFATEQEVLGLFASAGIQTTTYYYPNDPVATGFLSLIGSSGTINGYPAALANSGTPVSGGLVIAPSFYVTGFFGSPPNAYVYSFSDGTKYGLDTSYPDLADWLVAIPEPRTFAIAGLGIALFAISRRKGSLH